ncbi:Glycosyl hydrolases family 28 [Musa troglodytarum]|uniref:Glycosyl hydrolases family 28 n=1 Tax=Musa troglodytarum TaxID=320322 RepID=A0A9E7I5T2_9LILI|nr:Glycosyl hydrolases family 28 [Musa troglodytarum]
MVMQLKGQLLASTHLEAYTQNWIDFQYINGLVISGGGIFNGQGASAWPHNQCPKTRICKLLPVVNLVFSFVTNATISGISSVDSKLFHFQIFESRDITLDSIRISAPGDSPNTDGIHIADSTNIQVTNSVIGTVMTASPSPRLHQFDHLKCSMRSLAMASADLAKMLMRKMSTVWR